VFNSANDSKNFVESDECNVNERSFLENTMCRNDGWFRIVLLKLIAQSLGAIAPIILLYCHTVDYSTGKTVLVSNKRTGTSTVAPWPLKDKWHWSRSTPCYCTTCRIA
jgi:hypothetical protein